MFKKYILSLRPKQWIKNFFILLPLIFGRKLFVYPDNLKIFLGVILFSGIASSLYILNDIKDAPIDIHYPNKKRRPIVCGEVPLRRIILLSFLLGITSLVLSFLLDKHFGLVISAYAFLNLLYTFLLKRIIIIDVFTLGTFYLLRIIAGCVLINVELSYWIVIMTVLLSLFLGFNKRRQDIRVNLEKKERFFLGYTETFIDNISTILASSIIVSYMLYTVDERTVMFFGTRNLIFTTPFVLYGVFRYIYLINIDKDNIDVDPTNMFFKDRYQQVNIILWIIACIMIIYLL